MQDNVMNASCEISYDEIGHYVQTRVWGTNPATKPIEHGGGKAL